MNKNDVFVEKLKEKKISDYFKDYMLKDEGDVKAAQKYFSKKFLKRSPQGKKIYVHHTTAVDNENMKHVLSGCMKMILQRNIVRFFHTLLSSLLTLFIFASSFPFDLPNFFFPPPFCFFLYFNFSFSIPSPLFVSHNAHHDPFLSFRFSYHPSLFCLYSLWSINSFMYPSRLFTPLVSFILYG